MFNKESGLVKTWVTLIKNKQYTATMCRSSPISVRL